MRTITAIIALLALFAAACGDQDREPVDLDADAAGVNFGNLGGKEFWSTSVSEVGTERPLVEGTRISLRFEAGEVRVDAGCNNIGGTYTVDDDNVLVIDGMYSTEMGCDPERHAQDEFVIELLTSRPTLRVGTDTLTVATPTITIELVDREVAEVDEPLIGTEWVVDGFFDPIAATAYAVDVPASFVFGSAGQAAGFDGCGDFDITYQATEIAVTLAGAPDGSCSEYASAFAAVMGRGTLTYEIQGPRLTLRAEDGTGLTARSG